MSSFNLASGSTTETTTPAYITSPDYTTDEDEEDNLPYPTELPRSDFLKADFDPQDYLSSLRNRHQALEDLRSDLRSRSQSLNQELLDLVNGNYEEFSSLGADLNGGEDRVESVRVGLLGFTRDIEALRSVITSREAEFSSLLSQGKQIRRDIVLGRKLLEIEAGITSLEGVLGIVEDGDDQDDDFEDEEDADDMDAMTEKKLFRQAETFLLLEHQSSTITAAHPLLVSLQPRLQELRKVLILDMSTALRQAKSAKNVDSILKLNQLFADIGAEHEAVELLKAK